MEAKLISMTLIVNSLTLRLSEGALSINQESKSFCTRYKIIINESVEERRIELTGLPSQSSPNCAYFWSLASMIGARIFLAFLSDACTGKSNFPRILEVDAVHQLEFKLVENPLTASTRLAWC